MNARLSHFVDQLYADGVPHDAGQADRLLKHRNLEPASAELLSLVIRITNARQVLEIGTADGYSSIWIADAVSDTDGHLMSLDTGATDDARSNLALANSVQPGLADDGRRLRWLRPPSA